MTTTNNKPAINSIENKSFTPSTIPKSSTEMETTKTPTAPVTDSKKDSAKTEPVFKLEKGQIVPSDKLTQVLYDLMNTGFYIKNNDQKGTITASRYGKKGELKISLFANIISVQEKGMAPTTVDYDNYQDLIKAN